MRHTIIRWVKHRRSPQWGDGDPCLYTIIKWAGVAVVAVMCLWIGLAQGTAATAPTHSRLPLGATFRDGQTGVRDLDSPAGDRSPESGSLSLRPTGRTLASVTAGQATGSEYGGPFATMQVPAACSTPQANLRYYQDQAPAGTQFLRSGAHGHGGYLRCIYFYVDGPLTGSDHHYGKWLVFTAAGGKGLLIPGTGIEASYVNCALPGYHFPFPAGNGQPNDCGESWVSGEGASYVYQDDTAGDLGKPMFPAVLP